MSWVDGAATVAKILFENSTYRTHGDLPEIGSKAPDVSLVDTRLRNVSLADFMGIPPRAEPDSLDGLSRWIALVRQGLRETDQKYPFIAYGTDWLAFAPIWAGVSKAMTGHGMMYYSRLSAG